MRLAAVTPTAATAIQPRLARLRSIKAPAGVCARMPASAASDIAAPMLASSHFRSVRR